MSADAVKAQVAIWEDTTLPSSQAAFCAALSGATATLSSTTGAYCVPENSLAAGPQPLVKSESGDRFTGAEGSTFNAYPRCR